jgi:hypothetical protein
MIEIGILLLLGSSARYLTIKSISWLIGTVSVLGLIYAVAFHTNQLAPFIALTFCGGILGFVWLWLLSYFQDTIFTFILVLLGGDFLIFYLLGIVASGLHI